MAKRDRSKANREAAGEPTSFKPFYPRTENQKKLIHAIHNNQVIICDGPAGTGKTCCSTAMATQFLYEKRVGSIVVTRPQVTAGESMGYLPGDIKDKIDPFLMPVYNEFSNVLNGGKGELNTLLNKKTIEIIPIAYMRGLSIRNSFIIVDEAQNATYQQLKLILTRLCDDSIIVINGDPQQSDLRDKTEFSRFVSHIRGVKGVEVVTMTHDDIVRSKIVKDILMALEP